jgi:hypothetical protein
VSISSDYDMVLKKRTLAANTKCNMTHDVASKSGLPTPAHAINGQHDMRQGGFTRRREGAEKCKKENYLNR